ncbi:hypothetical protein [Novosphingobium terrae]|uniref:hypothetical protein n=1 Tax=Novosphingobium terrae TaxID=2726189 RepID=UPI00197DB0F0|nr:hypothetical protein [Novosphingobium terrae]
MAALSAIFYFLSQHSVLALPLIVLFWLGVGALLARLTKRPGWLSLGIFGFVAAMLNVFLGSSVNAVFVNAFGVRGSGVVTSARETSSQLNDQPVWAYDAVITTADGRDVKTGFDTMSISLYPPRNEIDVPPTGERFVVKYVPGFERNVAVMRDESPFGKRLLVADARIPVDRAANQLAASPHNAAFKAEYREALQAFLARYGSEADQDLVQHYRAELAGLR